MEFRRYLVSNGVSPAGTEEALTGQPVTSVRDQGIIRKLGYHVMPGGEVNLAKSLGPGSSLPSAWLSIERDRTAATNRLDRIAVQQATMSTMRMGRAETGVSMDALTAVVAKAKIDAGK